MQQTLTDHIGFTVSEGTYSIDDFNAKIKVAILQQRQHWEAPQIKDLRLVIPKDYLWLIILFFTHLVYKTTILRKLHSSDQSCPWVF